MKRKSASTRRGDLMRKIAALHARMVTMDQTRTDLTAAREKLKRQIAALTEQLMGPERS